MVDVAEQIFLPPQRFLLCEEFSDLSQYHLGSLGETSVGELKEISSPAGPIFQCPPSSMACILYFPLPLYFLYGMHAREDPFILLFQKASKVDSHAFSSSLTQSPYLGNTSTNQYTKPPTI